MTPIEGNVTPQVRYTESGMIRRLLLLPALLFAAELAFPKENGVTPLQSAVDAATEKPPIDRDAPMKFETATFAVG